MANAGTKDWEAVFDERFAKMEAGFIEIRNEFKSMLDNDSKLKNDAINIFKKACNLLDGGDGMIAMVNAEFNGEKQQPNQKEGGAMPAEPERKVGVAIAKNKKKTDVRVFLQRGPSSGKAGLKDLPEIRRHTIQVTVRTGAGHHGKGKMEGRKDAAASRRSKGTIKKEEYLEYFKRRKKKARQMK